MTCLVGVDIGGTNTDLIFLDSDDGRLRIAKVPSTTRDQAVGLLKGLDALGVTAADLDLLMHGTTVATNATIERKGARCGLITTTGFRDVLELRRRDRPRTYGLAGEFIPLIPRCDRREVTERIGPAGEELESLDVEMLEHAICDLQESGCEVLVIAFLHSYANPIHEQQAADIARKIWRNDHVVISSDVLPAIREFERTSTAVINGYVQPLIGRYLSSLTTKLQAAGLQRDLLVVQSNGGVMGATNATRFAANTILSGPAAGVTAAGSIARDLGIPNAVSCDTGGTSLDVCILRDAAPALTQNTMIAFGLPLALPMLDVDAIGAGGGSLARIDRAGLLQVGPESAGAEPGPVCYGRGGTIPTVTDACLVLGLLDPAAAIGKDSGAQLDVQAARNALLEAIGKPLGLSAEAAAEAVLTILGAKMAGHVRRKLLEKGLDPRDFTMIAFGGAGPLHANRLLREVGLSRAVVPLYPGITSAMGCVLGALRHDFMRTVNRTLSQLSGTTVVELCASHAAEGRQLLLREGATAEEIGTFYAADMCYRGQSNVITVPFPAAAATSWDAVAEAFKAAYRERYGRLLDGVEPVIVNVRTSVTGRTGFTSLARFTRLPTASPPPPGVRRVYYGGQWHDAQLIDRHVLPEGRIVAGPAVLTQADSTTFIEPGFQAVVHATGNIIIEARP